MITARVETDRVELHATRALLEHLLRNLSLANPGLLPALRSSIERHPLRSASQHLGGSSMPPDAAVRERIRGLLADAEAA